MNTTQRRLAIILGGLIAVALIGPALTSGMMGNRMMSGPGMMWGFGSGPLLAVPGGILVIGWLSALAFWGALILGVILLVQWMSSTTNTATNQPLEMLRRRYAAGEITREQYEQMLADLQTAPTVDRRV